MLSAGLNRSILSIERRDCWKGRNLCAIRAIDRLQLTDDECNQHIIMSWTRRNKLMAVGILMTAALVGRNVRSSMMSVLDLNDWNDVHSSMIWLEQKSVVSKEEDNSTTKFAIFFQHVQHGQHHRACTSDHILAAGSYQCATHPPRCTHLLCQSG